MASGFYKYENDEWLYGENSVISTTYTLLKEDKDTYTYPIDGWYWYDNSPIIATDISNEVQIQLDKKAFGQRVVAEFMVETKIEGVLTVNPILAQQLIATTETLFNSLDAGWLNMAILTIKSIPNQALNSVLTSNILLKYRNVIHDYLGYPRVSAYNE